MGRAAEVTMIARQHETAGTDTDLEIQRIYYARPIQLMWWQFRKHRVALISILVLVVMYLVSICAEALSPYDANERFAGFENAPPAHIHVIDEAGHLRRPFVYKIARTVDPETYRVIFVEDTSESYDIRLLVQAEPYKLLGIIRLSWRLFGAEGTPLFLFGSDHLGRDIYSRTLTGSRISLSIGFAGVVLTFVLGVSLGGLAGYLGGLVDEIIMRIIDFMVSVPKIPLWMALAAAIPRNWPVTRTYLAITIILSVVGWGGLARAVRGKLLSLREEDFVMAARLYGASVPRLILRYMIPNFMSYLLVNVTLSVPSMILSETSLSFLGLGIQPPAVSWGTLLSQAQQLTVVAQRPWQLIPGVFVVIAVLAFNFVGDGLRDAADPYARL